MIIFMFWTFFTFINEILLLSFIWLLKFVSFIYDLISFPVYYLIQKPRPIDYKNQFTNKFNEENGDYWEIEKLKETNQIKLTKKQNQLKEKLKDVKHFSEFIPIIRELYSGLKCMGRRKLINKIEDKKDGKLKYVLSDDYEWLTYDEILNRIDNLIKSFHYKLKLNKGDRIAIMADTSLEWLTTLFAGLHLGCEIISLHTSLDYKSICYILNSTNPKYLFTHSNIIKLINNNYYLKSNLNTIPKLVKFNNQFIDNLTTDYEIKNYDYYQYEQLIEDGKLLTDIDFINNNQKQQFSSDDIALILFTSGSTGQQKGVLLTHTNIIESAKNYINRLPLSFNMNNDDTFLCYLPISHSFEMICEITFFLSGIKLAYGTPSTLSDGSLLLSENSKGDIQAANATIWVAVPLVFERLQNRIKTILKNRSNFINKIYQNFAFEYKRKWTESGYNCKLIDKIFFKPIQNQYGGKLRICISGGGPLNLKTQIFLKNYLNINLILSYGSTECTVISMSAYDQSIHGDTMELHENIRCKLAEWNNYSPKNRQNPQGELLYSSKSLSIGYLNNEEETRKSFFIENGIRWWRSGDIGQIDQNGRIAIIDRKKDLVKLACGKYVAIGKIESILKNCKFVENIVMHCNSYYNNLIAIVQPNLDNLIKLAKLMKIDNLNKLDKLCENENLKRVILNELRNYGELNELKKNELPYLIKLSSELWTPSNNLLTASFKVNRTKIYSHFKQSIDLMYKELDKKSLENQL